MYEHELETTNYDVPALAFAPPAGISVPGNLYPDQAYPYTVVQMTITNHTMPSRKAKVNTLSTIPLINVQNNTTWGGHAVSVGGKEFPKVQIEGHIDTPTDSDHLPLVTVQATGQRMTYGELILAYTEGRVEAVPLDLGPDWQGMIWRRTDPIWYRDAYGRVFSNPKIIDFTANYVEAVPGRTTFSLQLVL